MKKNKPSLFGKFSNKVYNGVSESFEEGAKGCMFNVIFISLALVISTYLGVKRLSAKTPPPINNMVESSVAQEKTPLFFPLCETQISIDSCTSD